MKILIYILSVLGMVAPPAWIFIQLVYFDSWSGSVWTDVLGLLFMLIIPIAGLTASIFGLKFHLGNSIVLRGTRLLLAMYVIYIILNIIANFFF